MAALQTTCLVGAEHPHAQQDILSSSMFPCPSSLSGHRSYLPATIKAIGYSMTYSGWCAPAKKTKQHKNKICALNFSRLVKGAPLSWVHSSHGFIIVCQQLQSRQSKHTHSACALCQYCCFYDAPAALLSLAAIPRRMHRISSDLRS